MNKLSYLKIIGLCVALCIVAACKKKEDLVIEAVEPITVIKISPDTPYDAFYKRLSRALSRNGIKVGDYRQTMIPTLHIMQEDLSTEALEYDAQDKLKREEIFYELQYKVTDKYNNMIQEPVTLGASKEHLINPDNEISILNERDMITYELQQIIIGDIIKQLKELTLDE